MRPFTNSDWNNLPHVLFTSDTKWDPSIANLKFFDDNKWYNAQSNAHDDTFFDTFGRVGEYKGVSVSANIHISMSNTSHLHEELEVMSPDISISKIDYEKYRDYFLRSLVDVIKKTFEAT